MLYHEMKRLGSLLMCMVALINVLKLNKIYDRLCGTSLVRNCS
jgi:hypothetical protein